MSFSGYKQEMDKGLAGTVIKSNYASVYHKFENVLNVGVFCTIVANTLRDITPGSINVRGFIPRSNTNVVESGDTFDPHHINQVEMIEDGQVICRIKDGDTPQKDGNLYIEKDTAGQGGRATTDNTQLAIDGKFVEEVAPDRWVVRFRI